MYLAYTYYTCNKITGQFHYGSRYKNIKLNRTPGPGYKMPNSCRGDNHYKRRTGYIDPRKGRKVTPEQILKNSEGHKGIASKYKDIPRDEDTKLKLRQTYRKKYDEEGYVSPRKNAVWLDEYKKTKSADMRKFYETHSWPEYTPVICPHCGKEGKGNSMLRWHFDKCKLMHQNRSEDKKQECIEKRMKTIANKLGSI